MCVLGRKGDKQWRERRKMRTVCRRELDLNRRDPLISMPVTRFHTRFLFLEMTRVAAATLRVFLSFFSPKPARRTNRGRADCKVGPAF